MQYFFIGIAGSGMSAIAQYLVNTGNKVFGSDRLFAQNPMHPIRQKLEAEGIITYEQGKAKIDKNTDFVVVSTAIEPTVPEYQQAINLNIPVLHRSEVLKRIANANKTVAVAGTSGKSTTSAMIYTILEHANFSPSIINGAGLTPLIEQGKIGNSAVGTGDWLIIEADESDGSLVNYTPEIGIILNIDRDHKEFDELEAIFGKFTQNIKNQLIVNRANDRSKKFSNGSKYDFGTNETMFFAQNMRQTHKGVFFTVEKTNFHVPVIGLHNVENALAAISVAAYLGISLEKSAEGLAKYKGIDRRMQIIGTVKGITFIDDYAHNPAKIASAIKSAQMLSNSVFALFQPHGFAPMKFFKDEFIATIAEIMRPEDEFYMTPIYYAGGTVQKTITSAEIIEILQKQGVNSYLSSPREKFAELIAKKVKSGDIVLIMGARDANLGKFAKSVCHFFNK